MPCESPNFVWNSNQILGRGATGMVYYGVNKFSGEPAAVKTFRTVVNRRPSAIMQEFELLRVLDHENIVKLLAIEEETGTKAKVIVMELCSGDSLRNILGEPENLHGLCDEEFLLVVKDISAGIGYLRQNNIIHRDVKPDNIMKFIKDDGTSVYKLIDFGTARELKDDQGFESIHGTEEYLHPDIYGKALMGETPDKHFGANVDLWSIGATFYHVATGTVPFRPYHGRRNRNVMFQMITNKKPGVISASQESPNGPIVWDDNLPQDCLLSVGLRMLVRPIVAGLLQSNPRHVWSFERFFDAIQELIGRVAIHVFYVNHSSSVKVFLKKNDKFGNLQSEIQKQTKLDAKDQKILHKDQLIVSVEEFLQGEKCTPTSKNEPLMLFCTKNIVRTDLLINNPHVDIPIYRTPLHNITEKERDVMQAKISCYNSYIIKRHIDSISLSCYLVDLFVHQWVAALKTCLKSQKSRADALSMQMIYLLDTAHLLDIKSKPLLNWTEKIKMLNEDISKKWSNNIDSLYSTYIKENNLIVEWKKANYGIKYPHENKYPGRAKILVEKLQDSLKQILNFDENSALLERKKIAKADKDVKALLNTHCIPLAKEIAGILENWYNDAKIVYLKSEELDKHLRESDNELKKIAVEMKNNINTMKEEQNIVDNQDVKNDSYHENISYDLVNIQKELLNTCDDLKNLLNSIDFKYDDLE